MYSEPNLRKYTNAVRLFPVAIFYIVSPDIPSTAYIVCVFVPSSRCGPSSHISQEIYIVRDKRSELLAPINVTRRIRRSICSPLYAHIDSIYLSRRARVSIRTQPHSGYTRHTSSILCVRTPMRCGRIILECVSDNRFVHAIATELSVVAMTMTSILSDSLSIQMRLRCHEHEVHEHSLTCARI